MRLLKAIAIAASLTGGASIAYADPAPPVTPATPDPSAVSEPGGVIRTLYEGYYAALNGLNANPDATMPAEYEFGAIADRYFTPELAARFKKALDSEEPVFDWDWLVNGQDFGDLKIISVDAAANDGAKAVVKITTSNFGQSSTTAYDLVKAGSVWKIADVTFPEDGQRMTAFLKEAGY